MNLWISCLFLVAGVFLSSSAPTPEECRPLIEPLSLADPSMLYGRSNFLVGYDNHELFTDILKVTQSSWFNFKPSSSPNMIIMSEENKINGSCISATLNITIDGNSASMSFGSVNSEFHLLPSCDGCLLMDFNITSKNISSVLHKMNLTSSVAVEEISVHSLYLLGRESSLKDEDMQQFRKQASCLGFTREPDFLYDSGNGFCLEGEGVKVEI